MRGRRRGPDGCRDDSRVLCEPGGGGVSRDGEGDGRRRAVCGVGYRDRRCNGESVGFGVVGGSDECHFRVLADSEELSLGVFYPHPLSV